MLREDEFRQELERKLSEEIAEYEASREIEELADIEEIIRALVRAKGCTLREFEKLRKQKAAQNGAFAKRIFLETADD
jgi:predicted house-cleaning noncanonical NTP pyrophosphatase (MazG superfamily)